MRRTSQVTGTRDGLLKKTFLRESHYSFFFRRRKNCDLASIFLKPITISLSQIWFYAIKNLYLAICWNRPCPLCRLLKEGNPGHMEGMEVKAGESTMVGYFFLIILSSVQYRYNTFDYMYKKDILHGPFVISKIQVYFHLILLSPI